MIDKFYFKKKKNAERTHTQAAEKHTHNSWDLQRIDLLSSTAEIHTDKHTQTAIIRSDQISEGSVCLKD